MGPSLLAHDVATWGLIAFLLYCSLRYCSLRFFFEFAAAFGRRDLASSLVAAPATGRCSQSADAR
jgi:hypothetical protein